MKSIYMPNDSFNSKYEINIINKLLSKLSRSMLDDIDDKIEVWIIGNKDQEFFEKQTEHAYDENRVLDPIDHLPIGRHRKLRHIAVINHKNDLNSDLRSEIIYANSDFDVSDFVQIVINLLLRQYPKKKIDQQNNSTTGKRDSEDYALAG
jgi:hypothetical protein